MRELETSLRGDNDGKHASKIDQLRPYLFSDPPEDMQSLAEEAEKQEAPVTITDPENLTQSHFLNRRKL